MHITNNIIISFVRIENVRICYILFILLSVYKKKIKRNANAMKQQFVCLIVMHRQRTNKYRSKMELKYSIVFDGGYNFCTASKQCYQSNVVQIEMAGVFN